MRREEVNERLLEATIKETLCIRDIFPYSSFAENITMVDNSFYRISSKLKATK